jgi:nucleoside-diphosphate-sugar epimerase
MVRTLLTGGSGFVGNNLARYLLHEGHEVNLILRQDHADWRIRDIRGDLRTHITDLCDRDEITRIVQGIRPDWIFHLAAHGAYSTQTDALKILHTNTIGTANLLLACMETGFEAFVNAGSSSEYGFKDHPPRETERLDPNSYYAVAKAAATMFCTFTAQSTGARISTLRLYSVYGPYEAPTRLMPTLIRKGLCNQLPPLVNPDIARDFVYTEDVIQAFVRAATVKDQDPGAVYNVGTGIQTTLREVVDTVRRILNVTDEPEWASMPDRVWDTNSWVSDNTHIREELGWSPQYTFQKGFGKMVEWFEANPTIVDRYYHAGD